MENKTALQLLSFNFTDLIFNLNSSFEWPKTAISLNPILEKKIEKIDENTVKVSLFFRVDGKDDKPFSLKVILVGLFKCENWEKTEIGSALARMNTVNILFPYLRQAVSTLTTMAGIPPYILPIINTNSIREI